VTRPRLYLPQTMEVGHPCMLDNDTRRYVRSVLRLAEGGRVLLFNGSGKEGVGVIEHLNEKEGCIKILRTWPVSGDPPNITLAQSLPKAGKMDLVLQKATELGVCRIIPFVSARSIPRPDAVKAADRQDRWQKIVAEAARQCRRARVPEVGRVVPFAEMTRDAPADALRMILWEEEKTADIKGLLHDEGVEREGAYFIAVGPEGGFTSAEIEAARDHGFLTASLGRNILRTETAALAMITVIQYEKGTFFDLAGGKGS
jgi:16S rRNA (uracil1498-N3)-methyltransferase